MHQIYNPNKNDVLLGRGSFELNWEGTAFFRKIVRSFKFEYITAPTESKKKIAKAIVDIIYGLPGHFLKKDSKTSLWYEIGRKGALSKTKQALRNGAPKLVQKFNNSPIETDKKRKSHSHDGEESIEEDIIKVNFLTKISLNDFIAVTK